MTKKITLCFMKVCCRFHRNRPSKGGINRADFRRKREMSANIYWRQSVKERKWKELGKAMTEGWNFRQRFTEDLQLFCRNPFWKCWGRICGSTTEYRQRTPLLMVGYMQGQFSWNVWSVHGESPNQSPFAPLNVP